LQAYVAATSACLYHQKATSAGTQDLLDLPIPEGWDLDLSESEAIIADDVVKYQRDLVRLGDRSMALRKTARGALSAFNETFAAPINEIYGSNPLRALPHHSWPGIVCQPYSFADAEVDWSGADQLWRRLDTLLREQRSQSLTVTRIARIYDGDVIYLIKPDRLRFWLRSVALRDSDDVLADLRMQGF